MGPLRAVLGDEKSRGQFSPRMMVPLAIPLKYWDYLKLGSDLKKRFKDEFYHYYGVDKAYVENNPRDNQDIASHFVSMAYAYWATGDSLFLERAKEITSRMSYVYTEKDVHAVRCYYPGCYPDWTWNYAQRDLP